jgi:RHS repeat-associated protein
LYAGIQQLYVPLPGGAAAEYYSWGLSDYRHSDWLASNRLESSTTRTILDNNAYAPFGEPYAQTGNGEISFTGQNKDTVWLQYDFLARQYDPKQGRWISPDPAGLDAVDPSNPQTWNRYAYVANNPLAYVDPFGLQLMCPIAQCGQSSNGGPPGSTVDAGAGYPGGDGSVWSSIVSGVLYQYDWVSAEEGTLSESADPEYFNFETSTGYWALSSATPIIGWSSAPTTGTSVNAGMVVGPPKSKKESDCTQKALAFGALAAASNYVPGVINPADADGSLSGAVGVGLTVADTGSQFLKAGGGQMIVGAAARYAGKAGLTAAMDALDAVPVIDVVVGTVQAVKAVYDGVNTYVQTYDSCMGTH